MNPIEPPAKLFHGFADPSRLAILEALRRVYDANELADEITRSHPEHGS